MSVASEVSHDSRSQDRAPNRSRRGDLLPIRDRVEPHRLAVLAVLALQRRAERVQALERGGDRFAPTTTEPLVVEGWLPAHEFHLASGSRAIRSPWDCFRTGPSRSLLPAGRASFVGSPVVPACLPVKAVASWACSAPSRDSSGAVAVAGSAIPAPSTTEELAATVEAEAHRLPGNGTINVFRGDQPGDRSR